MAPFDPPEGHDLLVEVDLEHPPERLRGLASGHPHLVLAIWRGRPVGRTWITPEDSTLEWKRLRAPLLGASRDALREAWLRELAPDPDPPPPPPATVAVCTRARPEAVRTCLTALAHLPKEGHEVLVVDNCPPDAETRRVAQCFPDIRYLREDTPGTSAARNRALREASHDIVAFSDDDATPDPEWLPSLLGSFADPLVLAVTGLTLPSGLRTGAQLWFERFSTFQRGFRTQVIDGTRTHPLRAWMAGSSANLAVRRRILEVVGGFDPDLGPATPARAGEDVELFARILDAGYRIIYEPAAVSRHDHRREWESLCETLYGYGVGIYAAWTKHLLRRRDPTTLVTALGWLKSEQIPNALRCLLQHPEAPPWALVSAQLRGCAVGPLGYARSVATRGHRSPPDGEAHGDEAVDQIAQDALRDATPAARSDPGDEALRALPASLPSLSIVIPTHDRRRSVERTLDALGTATAGQEGIEVVVVADRCSDDTVPRLRERKDPFDLRIVAVEAGGAAAARNRGAWAARHDILLFLDDDVVPLPPSVEAHRRAHAPPPAGTGGAARGAHLIVQGPYPPVGDRTDVLGKVVRAWWHDRFNAMADPCHRFGFRDLLAGNVSLPRKAFIRLGGFDEAIPGAGGEDWELGIRAVKTGMELRFEPEAVAVHHESERLGDAFRRARQEGRVDTYLLGRHPDMRWTLPLAEPPRGATRVVQALAQAPGTVGWGLAGVGRLLLPVLERLRSRRPWRTLFSAIRGYWYWRGVREGEPGSPWSSGDAQDGSGTGEGPGKPPREEADWHRPLLDVDLAKGLSEVGARVDRWRPRALHLRWDEAKLGTVGGGAGLERLRGRHLPRLLREQAGDVLLAAEALARTRHASGARTETVPGPDPAVSGVEDSVQ